MDRDRLKEVRQTDLTESRINQDFLDWLKTSGVTWLLVIMVGLVVYMGFVRWNQSRMNYRTEAWRELYTANLPSALEEVAEKYEDVDAVSDIARLQAAEELMRAVQTGKMLGAAIDPADPNAQSQAPDLTDEERTRYLERADRLFADVAARDDGSTGKTLLVVTALTGRAVVAESRGDMEQAKQLYTQAAQRAGNKFPQLAERSRKRAETVAQYLAARPMAEVERNADPLPSQQRDPVSLDPWIGDLIGQP